MTENRLFYYPYATMTDAQVPLLKIAALYFDKLVLLDPREATWNQIGPDPGALDEVLLLERHGLLERIGPQKVLRDYSPAFEESALEDMRDPGFLRMCSDQAERTGRHTWSLALAKVPGDFLSDQGLRSLLGNLAPRLAREMGRRAGGYMEYRMDQVRGLSDFIRNGQVFDERRVYSPSSVVDYRYINVPLAVGEAIMVNHALFNGLLLGKATPISDDPFHSKILAHKLRRVMREPAVREILDDRLGQRNLRADLLASAALPTAGLKLPAFSPNVPVEMILEYRQDHAGDLARVRAHLASLAEHIETAPWTRNFKKELRRTVRELQAELDAVRRQRDDWIKHNRQRAMLSAAGLTAGTAAAVLSVIAAPVTPIVLAIAGLTLVSGTVIPGAEWLRTWKEGSSAGHENGLSYLLQI